MSSKSAGTLVRQRTMIDEKTGERASVMLIQRRVVDSDFFKIFSLDLLTRLAESAGVELPVKNLAQLLGFFSQLLAMAQANNEIYGTYDELAATFGQKRRTFTRYWGSLLRLGILKRIRYGTYILDPSLFSCVGNAQRIDLVTRYQRIPDRRKNNDVPGQQALELEGAEAEWLERQVLDLAEKAS